MVGSTEPRSGDRQPYAASSRGRIIGTFHHGVLVDHYVGNWRMEDTCSYCESADTYSELES